MIAATFWQVRSFNSVANDDIEFALDAAIRLSHTMPTVAVCSFRRFTRMDT
jgi:hypothetical protein